MVRLMLTLTPVVCILSGVAFSGLLELFLREDDAPNADESDAEDEQASTGNRRLYDKVCFYQFAFVFSIKRFRKLTRSVTLLLHN